MIKTHYSIYKILFQILSKKKNNKDLYNRCRWKKKKRKEKEGKI